MAAQVGTGSPGSRLRAQLIRTAQLATTANAVPLPLCCPVPPWLPAHLATRRSQDSTRERHWLPSEMYRMPARVAVAGVAYRRSRISKISCRIATDCNRLSSHVKDGLQTGRNTAVQTGTPAHG